jgi:hypothetical protein
MKAEVITFLLGYAFRATIATFVADYLAKPVLKVVVGEVEQMPKVIHYLSNHGGRSVGCVACKLGTPERVDSIS